METKALRILVFDYIAGDCAYTAKIVAEYCAGKSVPAEVRAFSENDPCIYDFEDRQQSDAPYHMAFVGADTMRGAEVARHLRGMDEKIPLFLVSEVSDMALEGFRLRALDYLTKPVSTDAVEEAVKRIPMNGSKINFIRNTRNEMEE